MAKVLLIDDEALLRANISAFLEDEGHSVMATASAESGLARLARFKPDVVIVDLRLQGVNGETFVRAASNLHPQVQFIIHTGSREYRLSDTLRALGIGADQLLYKPLPDLLQLSRTVKHLVKGNAAAGGASY